MAESGMTEALAGKPKKSVALSGVTAGNTALCTVGRTGNDLAYRGYDILDIAETCEFEESRLPARPRQAADAGGARVLQGASQVAARPARADQGDPRAHSRGRPSDGRAAHRRLGPRDRAAGEGGPRRARRARQRRPAAGLAGLDAALLVPLEPQRQADRRRDRRRLDRRPLSPPAARPRPEAVVGQGDAHVAHPVRRARIQRVDVRGARDRRHGLRLLFVHRRGDRRAARAEARRRERVLVRDAEALRLARRRRGGHPPAGREQGGRSSGSAIRCTRSPTRATR